MKINNYRKKVTIVLLITMAALAMLPVGAFCAQESAQGEKVTATREFTYREGETPDIPDSIIQFGQTLVLASVSSPVANKSLPQTRTHTYSVSTTYTPDQLAQAPSNVTLTPVYGEGKRQVDRKETIRNLPNNDVEKLPKRKTYTDTDGRGPGAAVNGDLALAEVRYEVTGLDTDGLPNKYSAHVVYRGEETFTNLLYYTAEEIFTRDVAEGGETLYTVVATYEGYAPAPGYGTDGGYVPAGPGDGNVPPRPDAGMGAGADGAYDAGTVEYSPVDDGPAGDALYTEGGDGKTVIPDAEAPTGKPSLLASMAGLPPVGVAALATVVAAAVALVTLGAYNRRKAACDDQ